jgi:hypothetical protein
MKVRKHYQQLRLNVRSVVMIKLYGGCSRQDQLMSQQLNFIDVSSVHILGVIMPREDLTGRESSDS